jgi:hypothetical protein
VAVAAPPAEPRPSRLLWFTLGVVAAGLAFLAGMWIR